MYTGQQGMQIAFISNISESVRSVISKINLGEIEEIRLRKNMPLTLHSGKKHKFVHQSGILSNTVSGAYVVSDYDIQRSMELLCEEGIYHFQPQISGGYITKSGHRVGIAGRVILQENKITYINDISGLNYRFAKEIIGSADKIIGAVLGEKVKNTLIVSPPGCGKTTILRDLSRQISNRGYKTLIVDERSEIAAMESGMSSYDIGILTDVLDQCPKAEGIMMGIRSLSPEVVICDEIGSEQDVCAIKAAIGCGVSIIASLHSDMGINFEKSERTANLSKLFDVIVYLSQRAGSGTVEKLSVR